MHLLRSFLALCVWAEQWMLSKAQSKDGSIVLFGPSSFPQISAACSTALQSSIVCPLQLLSLKNDDGTSFAASDLPILCSAQCAQSVQSYRSKVRQACGTSTWTDPEANMTLAFSAVADSFLFGYIPTCIKDKYESPNTQKPRL
jgi:hypothetical protein